MKAGSEKSEKKKTSEKPVSLDPLDFEEALRDLLTVKVPKEPVDKERKATKRQKKKPS